MTFIDIGANEGLFTLFGSRKVGDEGTVFALEPSRREFKRLMANLRLNEVSNVKAFQLGASDHTGSAELVIAGYQHEGHNTLGELQYDTQASYSEQITLVRLDDLIAAHEPDRVDMVKIDVEGSEKSVIVGMQETLRRYRPALIIEVFDAALRDQGSSSEELLEIIRSFDYELFIFAGADGMPAPLAEVSSEGENILALPEERVDSFLRALPR